MMNNGFFANSSVRVRCQSASDAITGANNTLETCQTCDGCPF